MNATVCCINDFVVDRRSVVMLGADDFARVEQVWQQQDKLLLALQGASIFTGRTRWGELDPLHWRVMLVRNLALVGELSAADCTRADHPTVRSLHFLLGGLIVCLQRRVESSITQMLVNRVSEIKVSYDYSASLSLAIGLPAPVKGFRIVIDNSEETAR